MFHANLDIFLRPEFKLKSFGVLILKLTHPNWNITHSVTQSSDTIQTPAPYSELCSESSDVLPSLVINSSQWEKLISTWTMGTFLTVFSWSLSTHNESSNHTRVSHGVPHEPSNHTRVHLHLVIQSFSRRFYPKRRTRGEWSSPRLCAWSLSLLLVHATLRCCHKEACHSLPLLC